MQAAIGCLVLALLCLLVSWVRCRKPKAPAKEVPLISVESTGACRGRVALIHTGSALPESALVKHIRRLLLERGFSEVRCATKPAELVEGCRGANLGIDLAVEAPVSKAAAATGYFVRACATHGVPAIIQCSDALVGYDCLGDVCDGDELSDPGLSLISPEPRPPPTPTTRLLDLRNAEAAIEKHQVGRGAVLGAIVLRLHRVYSPTAAQLPAGLPALLACGAGLACGFERAQTNLLHAEDAAYGVVLATDRLLASKAGSVPNLPTSLSPKSGAVPKSGTVPKSGAGSGVQLPALATAPSSAFEIIVLTDPSVWEVSHLLRCLACVLRVPSPLVPFVVPVMTHFRVAVAMLVGPPLKLVGRLVEASLVTIVRVLLNTGVAEALGTALNPIAKVLGSVVAGVFGLLAALYGSMAALASGAAADFKPSWRHYAHVHSYYTAQKAHDVLGFTPKVAAKGLHAALLAVRERAGITIRLVVPLEAAAVALFADAVGLTTLSAVAGAAGVLGALYALMPPPAELPAQPPIAPPLVAGGVPLLGHLLDFVKGPVGMIDNLRSQYRSMFTIRVGPQRITFMIGAGPQLQFIKAKDEVLDQAPVYGFTIPVFGEGIIYDSPLEERQQQVSAP